MQDTMNLHLSVVVSEKPIGNLVLDSWEELEPLVDRDVAEFVQYAKICNVELGLVEQAAIKAFFKWKTYGRRA